MKRPVLTAVALATILTACAAGRVGDKGFSPLLVTPPDPARPNVFIKNDSSIVVDQEPIYINKDVSPISITWAVADNSRYYFPNKNAISVTSSPKPKGFDCSLVGNPAKLITCTYERVSKEKYIYTITLTDGTKSLTSDPSIANE